MRPYDPTTALLVVDLQNDFADPRGSLSVAGCTDIVPHLNAEARAALAARAFVVYSQDWHPARTPHFKTDGGIWPVHCVADTWGSRFHPALEVHGPSVHKGANGEDGYSAFTMRDPATGTEIPTELEALLRARGIRRLVVGGVATDYCVRASVLDAIRLGFETEVLIDAIVAVDLAPGDGERAIAEMRDAGAALVRTTEREA